MANPTIVFSVKGRKFSLDITDVDGIEARDFRLAVGMPLLDATQGAQNGDIDTLELAAGVMWLLDRRENPAMTYEDALAQVSYASVDMPEEADESPPVEGGDSVPTSPPSLASTG